MIKVIEIAKDVLSFLSMATPIMLALGGMLTFFYREKLKSMFAKSIAFDVEKLKSDLAREAANHSAALQREHEAYKVSLIAESERIKASQDVRKSIAMKVAELRFTAIAALYEAHAGIASEFGALVLTQRSAEVIAVSHFLERRKLAIDRLAKCATALNAAAAFMTLSLRAKVLAVQTAAQSVLELRTTCDSEPARRDVPAIQSLLATALELETELRALLAEFEQA